MLRFSTTLGLLFVVAFAFGQHTFQCGQEETHRRNMKELPFYKEKQEQIEKFYRSVINNASKDQKKSSVATYTIPVVFHVMHKPEDPIGTGTNVSLARLQTELANWNQAFDNTGPYAGGPFHCNAGIPSSSVDINFCLATQDPLGFPTQGVERYAYDGASPLFKNDPSPNTGYLDWDMKETSNWNSVNYLNVWVVDEICQTAPNNGCGVVGYATLPGSSGTYQDGVVVQDDFVGTSTNNSKVMVHELGHYLNLYHTFQGGCSTGSCTTTGDRVCDTPLDNTTSYTNCNSSANTANTCTNDATVPGSPFSTDVQDMYENYMDYSPLNCVNTFTPQQAQRMEAVMMAGGGRQAITSSTGCNAATVTNTQVAFSTNTLTVSEGAASTTLDCREYSTFQIKIKISQLPTSDVTLNISSSGTATAGIDYDVLTSNVTFKTTGSLYKYVDVRVFNDNSLEGAESIVLSYSISGPAIAAASNQSITLTLKDNDVEPGLVFLNEDFESGSTGWIFSGLGEVTSPFVIGTNSGLTDNAAYITTDSATKPFQYNNSVGDDPLLISPTIDGSEMSGGILTFNYQANGASDDYGRIGYLLGPNYNVISFFYSDLKNQGSNVNTASVSLPSTLNGQSFKIGFNWANDGDGTGQNPPLAVDNINISTQAQGVSRALNSSAEEYLGPNETVLFYSANNEIIAKIKNNSAHDYGCTTVTIDRAGTGATNGTGDYSTFEFMDKTILITPTNNNASGSYELTLYYAEAEIAGWETATGLSRTDLSMFKSTGSIANAQSTNSESINFIQNGYGTDWAFVASFNTGFSGFGFSKVILPLDLISFDGEYKDEKVDLTWLTTNEVSMDKIIVEKSRNGIQFDPISHVQPKGLIRNEYNMTDYQPFLGKNYYRLKFVDLDGSVNYSQIISVNRKKTLDVIVYPNPISKDRIQLNIQSESNRDFTFAVYNIEGVLIKEKTVDKLQSNGMVEIPFYNQEAGMYYIKVISGNETKVVRFLQN